MARVLPIRVATDLTADGYGALASAIDYAVSHGANVINLSLVAGRSGLLQDAINAALAANVIVVAGVGNADVTIGVAGLASYGGVIAVAAVDINGRHAAISVTGPEVVLSAPGVDIVSTDAGGGYRIGTGTSDATAIVSGAAALVRSRFPNLSAAEVVHRLTATATDAGSPGRDEEYGFGVLNLVDALTKDVPLLQGPTTAAVAPTARATPGLVGDRSLSSSVVAAVVLLLLLAAAGAWTLARRRHAG